MEPGGKVILVVEDDAPMRRVLVRELQLLGYATNDVDTVEDARQLLARVRFSLVLTDLVLPDGTGMDVLAAARRSDEHMPVVVLSGVATIDNAVEAIKRGATDFLQKPVDPDRLAKLMRQSIEAGDARRQNAAVAAVAAAASPAPAGRRTNTPAAAVVVGGSIIGESAAIRQMKQRIAQVAATDTTVLVQGESGTGKELVARALHEGSPRRSKPFVAIDCGALDGNLLASELFGHVRGAFTGADTNRAGLFQAAHEGTLFLDEIGNLSLELQARLLRAVQERRVRPLGGNSEREIDVRVVAATNNDLRIAVAAGTFRQDLYYRLAVVTLTVPPLRERTGDIPLLVRHLAESISRRVGRPVPRIAEEAVAALAAYPWPGNVRELANVVERGVILAQDGVVHEFELPAVSCARGAEAAAPSDEPLDHTLRRAEEEAIRRALRLSGSKTEAARRLGISRRALYDKLDKLLIGGGVDEK